MKTNKLKKLALAAAVLLCTGILTANFPLTARADSQMSLEELMAKFPGGKYWNHQVNEEWQYGDKLYHSWNDSFADSVSDTPCATHNGTPAYGQYDCNAFQGSMQCCGFARKLAYDAYGSHSTTWDTGSLETLKPGDVLHYYGQNADAKHGHWVFITGVNGDAVTVGECNSEGAPCLISWGRTIYKSACTSAEVYSAPSVLRIYADPVPSKPTLTVKAGNAETDTVLSWTACTNTHWYDIRIYTGGTENIYKDLYRYKDGTSYKITLPAGAYYANIASVNENGKYTFSDNVSFTVAEIPIRGQLQVSPGLSGKTHFEWTMDDRAANVALIVKNLDTKGTVEIAQSADRTAADAELENGNYRAELYGIPASGTGRMVDAVEFTVGEKAGWTYCSALPSDITDTVAAIEYRQVTSQVAAQSPGEGWVQGDFAKTVYEKVGAPYESTIELPTSETRELVSYYYYHYCSGSKGTEVNYEATDEFPHYDAIGADHVQEAETGLDSADNRYRYYYLKWTDSNDWAYCKSGSSCDGSAGEHGARSFVWYRCSIYQDKTPVKYYNYTLPGDGWSADNQAAGATGVRYRLNSDAPAFTFGDVNDDGSIDLKDVTLMRRALAGWDVTLNRDAADTNNDGSFDLKDVVLLRRYLAGGWDVQLG